MSRSHQEDERGKDLPSKPTVHSETEGHGLGAAEAQAARGAEGEAAPKQARPTVRNDAKRVIPVHSHTSRRSTCRFTGAPQLTVDGPEVRSACSKARALT